MTRSISRSRAGSSDFNSAAGIADGCATSAFKPGAKRSISAAQLASSDAGATSRLGCGCALVLALEHQQQREHLNGLAESHVVGQARAETEFGEQIKPAHAHLLVGPQHRLAAHRRDRSAPSPADCAARSESPPARGRRPLAPSRHRPRRPYLRGAATSAPASSRMASPKVRPFSFAVRSTSPKRSIMLCRCSRSTSTQRPRTSASPSDLASRSRISAAVSGSPSSVTSIGNRAARPVPDPDGVLRPTVPVTCGRGGRLPRHAAGMRTTTPAVSSCGTSRRSCKASRGVQRSG